MMFSSAQLLPSTELPAPMYAQLQVPVATTGLPHSTMWLQQDAAHQPLVVSLTDGGVVQHTPLLQLSPEGVSASAGMQQMAAQPPAQAQGPAGSVDVGRLKAVLQNVLASLHASQPASTASSSAAVPQQLQGPGAMLGLPQPASAAQYVQPQPPQQVYVTPSGQQVVLVGGGQPMMLQEGPAYAYAADGGNNVQLQPVLVPSSAVLGSIANNQQVLVTTADGQEVQALFNAEVPQPAVMPPMTNSGAYGMPVQLADFTNGMIHNVQASAALGAGYVAVGANQAWHNSGPLPSTSSSASSQQLFVFGASEHSSFQMQQQQLLPSNSPQAGIHAGNAPGHAGALAAFAHAPQGPGAAPAHAAGIAHAHAGALAPFNPAAQGAAPPAPAHAVPAAPAQAATPAPAHAAAPAPADAGPAAFLPAPWATMPLLQGLQLLWDNLQLQEATGGRIYNTAERMAWQPPAVVELSAQDLYEFPKLKYMVHKLNAVHKIRVRLIKRLHAVADFGGGELKSVYFEVRCIITEMMRTADAHRWERARITDLVRLALALQEALVLGPGAVAAAAAAE